MEIACILGKKKMEKTATLHSRLTQQSIDFDPTHRFAQAERSRPMFHLLQKQALHGMLLLRDKTPTSTRLQRRIPAITLTIKCTMRPMRLRTMIPSRRRPRLPPPEARLRFPLAQLLPPRLL